MDKPLLVIFIGVPGSGKTYFASRLATKIDGVRLNSDAMRLSIFGSLEAIEEVHRSKNRSVLNSHTFGAMDYATRQILATDTPVIYEAIQRTQADRRNMEKLADECGAQLVLVSMEIDIDTAIRRVQEREARDDVRQFDGNKAREVIAHFRDRLEPLERTDYVVHICGEEPFETQYESFQAQLLKLLHP